MFAVIESHLPTIEFQCITGGRLSLCHLEPIVAQEQHTDQENVLSESGPESLYRSRAFSSVSHVGLELGQTLDTGPRVHGDVEAPL